MEYLPLIIQLITGAVGGNVAGSLMKNLSLGTLWNSVAGIIGVTLLNKRWKLLYQIMAVIAVYLMWYLKYGESQATSANFSKIPKYVYDSAVFSAAALGTTSAVFGGLLLGVLITLLISNFKRHSTTT